MANRRATAALVAQRRKDAVELRVAGVDLLTIARQLAADPAINLRGESYPHGYGVARYEKGEDPPSPDSLMASVVNDIARALDQRQTELSKSVDKLIELAAERLEKLFYVAFKEATTKGNLNAIDKAVRILERQAKLLGLDAPSRSQVAVETELSDEQLDAELERVLTQLARLNANP